MDLGFRVVGSSFSFYWLKGSAAVDVMNSLSFISVSVTRKTAVLTIQSVG